MKRYRLRRFIVVIILLLVTGVGLSNVPIEIPSLANQTTLEINDPELNELAVKGRALKTGYKRTEFGSGWDSSLGCDTRNRILARDLTQVTYGPDGCKVQSGLLNDPYTGKMITFSKGESTSDDVQIDHVVALSNAWQTGAQQLAYETRVALANDPLNLFAVDGPTNEKKSDDDAATWLPPNKSFRCQYVKRQVSVKVKYTLWVTPAEKDAVAHVLSEC